MNDIKELWQYKELLYFFHLAGSEGQIQTNGYRHTLGADSAIHHYDCLQRFFLELWPKCLPTMFPTLFSFMSAFFSGNFFPALGETSSVLISNQSIITKVYFPRLILPLSSVATKFVDFIIAAGVLVMMMIYYGYLPHLKGLLIIPILLIITFMASVGGGLLLAAVNVKYRDVRYALPFSFKFFFSLLLLFIRPALWANIPGSCLLIP